MNEPLFLILALLAGALLGAFFFGGLWWTVQKGLTAQNPALWFLGSMLVRTGVTLVGFYFVSDGRWERMVACLLGFLAAKFVVLKMKKPSSTPGADRSVNS
ncbi:MAG: ATP synthase subunit I [Lewinellaceae bacterium]|nr:ATP synthase subunit I [Lewinellaceae bacterium]